MPAAKRVEPRWATRLAAASDALMIAAGGAPTSENVRLARERFLTAAEESPAAARRFLDTLPPGEFPIAALGK